MHSLLSTIFFHFICTPYGYILSPFYLKRIYWACDIPFLYFQDFTIYWSWDNRLYFLLSTFALYLHIIQLRRSTTFTLYFIWVLILPSVFAAVSKRRGLVGTGILFLFYVPMCTDVSVVFGILTIWCSLLASWKIKGSRRGDHIIFCSAGPSHKSFVSFVANPIDEGMAGLHVNSPPPTRRHERRMGTLIAAAMPPCRSTTAAGGRQLVKVEKKLYLTALHNNFTRKGLLPAVLAFPTGTPAMHSFLLLLGASCSKLDSKEATMHI